MAGSQAQVGWGGTPRSNRTASREHWWESEIGQPLRSDAQLLPVDPETLALSALAHSAQISAIRDVALIEETTILEAESAFDWRTFVESRYRDTTDPVGNSLTTGGPLRFRDHFVTNTGGLRRTMITGGELEVSQALDYQDNNSEFFFPNQQATARLSLNLTQPLLNGAGRMYNQSRIVLAQVKTDIARDEALQRIQDQLMEVNKTYWELYQARARVLQKARVRRRAEEILAKLRTRGDLDVLASQVARAEAVVAVRTAELARADATMRNAESRLRALINDPQFASHAGLELVPHELPARTPFALSIESSLESGLQNRPDLGQAMKAVESARVELGITENALLPALDFVMSTYVTGLRGESDIVGAHRDQFTMGQPSYTVGLLFDVPLGNRGPRSRRRRAELVFRQAMQQLQATTAMAMWEIETAVRDIAAAYREIAAAHQSLAATEAEVRHLSARLELLADENQPASVILNNLLDAQDRLAEAEQSIVTAQVRYMTGLAELKRATGTLVQEGPPRPPFLVPEPAAEHPTMD